MRRQKNQKKSLKPKFNKKISYKTFPENQGLTITIRLKDLKNRYLKNLKKINFFLKFWIFDGAYAPSPAHMRKRPDCLNSLVDYFFWYVDLMIFLDFHLSEYKIM